MPYPMLLSGGSKDFSVQMFDSSNQPVDYPVDTTFSAFTSDFTIATATMSSDGKTVTVTPAGNVTGNVLVTPNATIPGNTAVVFGAFWIHVMEAPLSEKEYLQVTPA